MAATKEESGENKGAKGGKGTKKEKRIAPF
jgi:hypothetical protein